MIYGCSVLQQSTSNITWNLLFVFCFVTFTSILAMSQCRFPSRASGPSVISGRWNHHLSASAWRIKDHILTPDSSLKSPLADSPLATRQWILGLELLAVVEFTFFYCPLCLCPPLTPTSSTSIQLCCRRCRLCLASSLYVCTFSHVTHSNHLDLAPASN
jgi:hypothetical protein